MPKPMTEDKLWNRLLEKWRYGKFKGQRIESALTGSGIPDCVCVADGVSFWMELKIIEGVIVPYRKYQPAWLESWWRAGGASYTLAWRRGHILVWRGDDSLELAKGGCYARNPIWVSTDGNTNYDQLLLLLRSGHESVRIQNPTF